VLLPLLLLSLAVHAAEVDRRIAVTIDDLPWARVDEIVPPDLQARHEALMAQLHQAGVPVVGFVNENKLEVDGQVQPARVQMLRDWLDAGYVLGNHTYSHMDLNAKGVAAFQQDFLRGETVLRPLLAERGRRRSGCATPTCVPGAPRKSACRWMCSSSSMATAWHR
jgi:peptidoglycan/xylan/chitin deacetylase (PgdA/CDA1 family)